jgi:hypothetical protein
MYFDVAPPVRLTDQSSLLKFERHTLPWDILHKEVLGVGKQRRDSKNPNKIWQHKRCQERTVRNWLTSDVGKEMSSISHDGETVGQETCIKEGEEQVSTGHSSHVAIRCILTWFFLLSIIGR